MLRREAKPAEIRGHIIWCSRRAKSIGPAALEDEVFTGLVTQLLKETHTFDGDAHLGILPKPACFELFEE